ncbi:MAG TPA: hypothetical protein VIM92_12090 [Rhodanobacteraceae bacterium]
MKIFLRHSWPFPGSIGKVNPEPSAFFPKKMAGFAGSIRDETADGPGMTIEMIPCDWVVVLT